jgi:hypothetical protein
MHSGIRVDNIDPTRPPAGRPLRPCQRALGQEHRDPGRPRPLWLFRHAPRRRPRSSCATSSRRRARPTRTERPAAASRRLVRGQGRRPLPLVHGRGNVEARRPHGLQDLLDDIAALTDTAQLPAMLGTLAHAGGVEGPSRPYVNTDDRQSDRYVVYLNQGGLGLPDESYYREERHAETRAAYLAHVAQMLTLAGRPTRRPRRGGSWPWRPGSPAGTWTTSPTATPSRPTPCSPPRARRAHAALRLGRVCRRWAGSRARPRRGGRPPARLPDAASTTPWPRSHRGLARLADLAHAPRLRALPARQAFVEENFDFYGRTLAGTPAAA